MRKLLTLLLWASPLLGQQWSGILNSGRAVPWESTVAFNGPSALPDATWPACTTGQAGTTVPIPSSVTSASTIATALTNCSSANPNGSYLSLGSGTFTLSATLLAGANSKVVLRGSGPLATIIKWSGASQNCGLGQVCGLALGPISYFDGSAAVLPGGTNSLALTGTTEGGANTFPWGATHITVGTVGSDTPKVGTMLLLDQVNDQAVASGVIQGDNTTVTSGTSLSGNDGAFGRGTGISDRRSQTQAVVITACNGSSVRGTSCGSSTTYTISPGLYFNNIRSSQSPGAWWMNGSTQGYQLAIESLTIDDTNNVGQGTTWMNCYQCWAWNVRWVCTAGASACGRSHQAVGQSLGGGIFSSYVFGSRSGGGAEGYGFEPIESSGFLVENTIFDQTIAAWINDNPTGFVYGYDYIYHSNPSSSSFLQCAYFSHDTGAGMNLYEGLDGSCLATDNQHGTSPLYTVFRSDIKGNDIVPNDKSGSGSQTIAINADSYARVGSFIGNVLGVLTCSGGSFAGRPADSPSQCTGGTLTGASYETTYEVSPALGCANGGGSKDIFAFGYGDTYQCGSGSGTSCPGTVGVAGNPGPSTAAAGNDCEVGTSMLRWGNSDSVTATTRFNSSEVPTGGGTFYSGVSVPSSHTLPASFYYTSKPAWWNLTCSGCTTPPWPPIGPDVTGGNLTTSPAGLANEIPARECFENTAQDSTNYPSTAIKAFDANNCYSTSSAPIATFAPTSLNIGQAPINLTSNPSQTITLTNTGTANLVATGVTVGTAFFSLVSNTCGSPATITNLIPGTGFTLTPNSSCTFQVTFSPTAPGMVSDTVTFADNAGNPDRYSIQGTATGPPGPGFTIFAGNITLKGSVLK